MKIEGREISTDQNYLDPVTYIPNHANGDASHPDCERGVIISPSTSSVMVLYFTSRTVQSTSADDLVWG